jgi:hypothetical protein
MSTTSIDEETTIVKEELDMEGWINYPPSVSAFDKQKEEGEETR